MWRRDEGGRKGGDGVARTKMGGGVMRKWGEKGGGKGVVDLIILTKRTRNDWQNAKKGE